MHFTYKQLQSLLALARTGSVSAAAEQLHVTQPTVSMQLKELAQQVGMPLYEVVSRKVYFTEVGERLVATAAQMQSAWEGFEQVVADTKGMARGRLRVSVVSTAKYFMPRLLGEFCKRYPAIDLELEVLNRDGVIRRLEANLDDLYIMSRPPVHLALEDHVIRDNPLVVIVPLDHPLAGCERIAPAALNKERFIFREQGSGTRMAVDEHIAKLRLRWKARLVLGNNEAIREAVAGGLGLAVLSRYALPANPSDAGVVVLDVKGFPVASRWHAVHPTGRQLTPVATEFLQAVQRHGEG